MSGYKYKAICHTKCFFKNTLWAPGEVYEGNDPPNKHFNEDGKVHGALPPRDAGMDKRSNEELRAILKKKFGSTKPKSYPRKKLWQTLKDFEAAAARDAATPEEDKFFAKCGFQAKTLAGKVAHERTCEKCKGM